MSIADLLQLAIAASTAVAAIAAWRSARASRESVVQQKAAGDAAAKNAKEQMTAFSSQVQALSEHATTVGKQAQAEAIRWSLQAHLDLEKFGFSGAHQIAFQTRGPVAATEFALFRAGLLPRDFFGAAVVRHLLATVLDRRRPIHVPPIAIVTGIPTSEVFATGGDVAEFARLWKDIQEAINSGRFELGANGQLTEAGKTAACKAALDALDKTFPAGGSA